MNRLGRFDNSVAHVQGANYFSCDLSEYSAAMSGFFYFTISIANLCVTLNAYLKQRFS